MSVAARLARTVSTRPGVVALVAFLVCCAGTLGLARWSVDSGQDLLVGSQSAAGQTYARFAAKFGGDPIVVVLTADNPAALYNETNLKRLAALEVDLVHDPAVQSVLGPGTAAGSAQAATESQVNRVLTEYPRFVADLDYLRRVQKGESSQTTLTQEYQQAEQSASTLISLYVAKAAVDADQARQAYVAKSPPQTDLLIDSEERAAEAAAAKDPLPPLFGEYLGTTDTGARTTFDEFTAAYGDCSAQLASVLKTQPNCQYFLWRLLLDLPHCPTVAQASQGAFCTPKQQWAAILPKPQSFGSSTAIVSVRLTASASNDPTAARRIEARIRAGFGGGVKAMQATGDQYLSQLQQSSDAQKKQTPPGQQPSATVWDEEVQLGALLPTECAGETTAASGQQTQCAQHFHDAPLGYVIAGAPLLTAGITSAVTGQLAVLAPAALVLMLVLLVVRFRVRGRLLPLLAAAGGTGITLGVSRLVGVPVTPAVLAGVPVLVGLAVDYAVQVVARYDAATADGAEDPLQVVMTTVVPATFVAAAATLAGLLTLAIVSGIDAGSTLVAVPLVAEFAVVLCFGIVFSWLASVLIALPLAVLLDRRGVRAERPRRREPRPAGTLPLRLASRAWVVGIATGVVALIGWAVLPRVPVQTDLERLVAPGLAEVHAIDDARAQTGYANEIDLFVEGDVAGPDRTTTPAAPGNVVLQGQLATEIHDQLSSSVAQVTSIADFAIAGGSTGATPQASSGGSSGTSGASGGCPTATASPGATPCPSPSAGASPTSLRLSPTARLARTDAVGGEPAALVAAARFAAATSAAAPTAAPPAASGATAPPATGAATPPPTAAPVPPATASASPQPSAQHGRPQTEYLCNLRLTPLLSRTLVMDIPTSTQPCPPVDQVLRVQLTQDTTPIDPHSARIALGVNSTALSDQAAVVHTLDSDTRSVGGGLTVTPTGLAVLAVRAYDTITSHAWALNLVPLALVFLLLLALHRAPRRAVLAVLPTAFAAGWAPLVVLLLGRLPGGLGDNLGRLNPLTVVLGAVVVALGTEFGVVLLSRFHEELERGLSPDEAATAALNGTGRAIRVSALTLAGGFAVLAVSGLFPGGIPLLAVFGFSVVIDLALAVAAVFWVMLPVAIAWERAAPAVAVAPAAVVARPAAPPPPRRAKAAPMAEPVPELQPERGPELQPEPEPYIVSLSPDEPEAPVPPATAAPAAASVPRRPQRLPGVTGRRRTAPVPEPPAEAEQQRPRPVRPGVTGRRRPQGTRPIVDEPPGETAAPQEVPAPEGVGSPRDSAPAADSEPASAADSEPATAAGRPRSRRRRPPPWVRRQLREGGTPPAADEPD